MSKPKVIEKTPISISELKTELSTIQKRDTEMNYRAGKTLEYVNMMNPIPKTHYQKLKSELEHLNIPRLKDEHIVKILDFMPKNVNELSVILQGYTLTVTKENMSKIIKLLEEDTKK